MKYFDQPAVVRMLTAACSREGGQSRWAAKHGLSHAYVSDVVRGRRDPGESICEALGLEKRTVYIRVLSENS